MKAAIVNNQPVSRVDSVVRIPFALADEMRACFDAGFRSDRRQRHRLAVDIQRLHRKPPISQVRRIPRR
nr:hypothetical protein [Burkholderia cepacia]